MKFITVTHILTGERGDRTPVTATLNAAEISSFAAGQYRDWETGRLFSGTRIRLVANIDGTYRTDWVVTALPEQIAVALDAIELSTS